MSKRTITRSSNNLLKQFGFFDLGIALVILAVSGLSVYTTDNQRQDVEAPRDVAETPAIEAADQG